MFFKSDYGVYNEDLDWTKEALPDIQEAKIILKDQCGDLFDFVENGDNFERLVARQHTKVQIVCIMSNSLFRPTNDEVLDEILRYCYRYCQIVLLEDLECAAN